jgi:hypothetical protein
MAFVVLKPLLDRLAAALGRVTVSLVLLYLVPVLFLVQFGLFLEPHFPKSHALVGDWYSHALYFSIFAFGYLMAGQLQIVRMLVRHRRLCLGIALSTYVLLLLLFRGVIFNDHGSRVDWVTSELIQYLNGWAWLLAVMAWAAARLNRPSRALSYMNTAILPWYVLHQSITIVLAWYLSPLDLDTALEACLLVAGTVAGCALGYEIIRRFILTRFLFGLKTERRHDRQIREQALSTP